jgi:hypothetical protein
MDSCHLVITPFPIGFKLKKIMAPITTEDGIVIHDVFYKSVIGNLMHAMVCIRLDLVILFFIFVNSWIILERNIGLPQKNGLKVHQGYAYPWHYIILMWTWCIMHPSSSPRPSPTPIVAPPLVGIFFFVMGFLTAAGSTVMLNRRTLCDTQTHTMLAFIYRIILSHPSLDGAILIGPKTLIINGPLLVICFNMLVVPSHGNLKNNLLLPFQLLKLYTWQLQVQLRKHYGFIN